MIPDSPFNHPVSSFQRPVPPPTVDFDATPTCSVAISEQWVPYVVGALWQLVQPSTWQSDDPATVYLAQQRAMSLIAAFTCGTGELPFICLGNATSDPSPFATWTIDSGCGIWFSGFAYQGALCSGGGHDFNQAAVIVTLDNPVTLTFLRMTFNMTKGHFTTPSGFDQVYLRDSTHGTLLAAIDQGSLVNGEDLTLEWAGAISGVSVVELVVTSDEFDDGGPASGACAIIALEMHGVGIAPC